MPAVNLFPSMPRNMSLVAGGGEKSGRTNLKGQMPTSLSLRPNEHGTETAFIPGQSLINFREKLLFVIRHLACQIKVIGVVIAVQTTSAVEVIQKQSGFQEDLLGGEHLKMSLPDLVKEKGVDFWDKRTKPDKVRCDDV